MELRKSKKSTGLGDSMELILSEEETEIVQIALIMRKNYIMTGDVCLSALDALNCGKKDKVKALTDSQVELLQTINKLLKCLTKEK